MILSLPKQVEDRLRAEATRLGISPEDLVRQLIEEGLAKSPPEQPKKSILEMLDRWDEEDRTDDPDEIARRRQDFEEFARALNESHTSHRRIYDIHPE